MDERSYSALEDKKVALEDKLEGRSLVTRIVFSTEDNKFLAQVLREITFAIEVTTVMSLYLFSNRWNLTCPASSIWHWKVISRSPRCPTSSRRCLAISLR